MARTSSAKSSNTNEKETGKVPNTPATAPARNGSAHTTPAPVRNIQSPVTPVPVRTSPSQEQIARRAYEIFLARGGQQGSPEQDWLQAERELQLSR